MPTFPEFIGGFTAALKPSKVGPFKVGTLGTRYAVVLDSSSATNTIVTTDTTTTTQFYTGSAGGEGIIWDVTGSNPGTSTDTNTNDGYVTQTAYVQLGGTADTTQTFTYSAPLQVGTVFSTAFAHALETITTTFVNTNTFYTFPNRIATYKSTNTGQTWAEQDVGDSPLVSGIYNQYSACQDVNTGTGIHIIFMDNNDLLTHIPYDCGADLYGSPTEGPPPQVLATDVTPLVTMEIGCIHQPSGNNIAVMVQSTTGGTGTQYLSAIQYAVAGGWGGYSLMGTGTNPTGNWSPAAIICGESDLVTCLQESMPLPGTQTNIQLWQQAINGGGSPGSQEEITAGESPGGEIAAPYPADLCWNSVDNVVTGVFFLQGFDSQTIYSINGASADPISFSTHSFAGATGGSFVEDVAVAVNGAGTYIFWPSPDSSFSFIRFFYVTNLGATVLIGTTTDYPEATPSLDAAGFSSSVAIAWNDGADGAERYWEIFPPSFTGHKCLPQYIKRFNAPGH